MYGDKDCYITSDGYIFCEKLTHQNNLLARYTFAMLYLNSVCPCANIVVSAYEAQNETKS